MPVESARAVFLRVPAEKCATTVIRAPSVVETLTPTFLPSTGCLRVTDALQVSGAGGGEAVGVGVGDDVGDGISAAVGLWVLEHAASVRALTANTAGIRRRVISQLMCGSPLDLLISHCDTS